MLETVDLSYYKILPQQFGSIPKMLVSEITNDIEFYSCTDAYNSSIDYATSKVYEILDIPHEKVYWGTDLKFYEDRFVSITKFNLNKQWVYFNDDEIFKTVKNKKDLEFSLFLTSILGGSVFKDDVAGFVENNIFVKAFHFSTMFEIELALHNSSNPKAAQSFIGPIKTLEELLDEEDKVTIEGMMDYLEKFISIKKSDWFDILQFPVNSKFEKCKFWTIKKFSHAQKLTREYLKNK
jgi:hypothetical protein